MSKLPSLQFYPGDRLREVMPIMGDSEAMGAWVKAWMYLWDAGPSTPEILAKASGLGWDRVGFLFSEKDGLLYLPWMEEKRAETIAFRERQARNGSKGGRPKAAPVKARNPSLSSGLTQTKAKKSPRVEGGGEGEDLGIKEKERARVETHAPEIIPAGITPAAWDAIGRWRQHRKEIGKPMKPTALEAFVKRCREWGEERTVAAIDHSIANGWQGCYEPITQTNGSPQNKRPEHLTREERRAMVLAEVAKHHAAYGGTGQQP